MKLEYYYLGINFLVFAAPFALSFDKRVHFFKSWKPLFVSILAIGFLFVVGDICFTHKGYWGFNQVYLTGFDIVNLPVEEVLFFITIPYACVFMYACLCYYLKGKLPLSLSYFILIPIALTAIVLGAMFYNKVYTISAAVGVVLIVIYLLIKKPKYLPYLALMYVLSTIPFLMVNGVLTGSGIDEQIVWYNEEAIIGFRVLTIPVEDFMYSFNLLTLNVILFEFLKKKFKSA